ncbi:MAG: undecaprenyldiphospho-muramoylpentapeptide beta-N-acetylglucosaminyltransferase [Candidatus Omnitrophica bacterium]|nr:undecaprenyldiphospho-muramoylpentapeptide beta-N-acetylglucosaminyltransferase [Candidatus Omnitrophota bacterium]
MKIVMATGGSAGHLFPAIEAAKCLREESHEVIFIGAFGAGKNRISNESFYCEELKAKGLQGKGLVGDLKAVVTLLSASYQALLKLRKIKPHVVVGFGGYGAFPVVMASILLRIPTMIHEQNVLPGRANKLLSYFVNKVAISFKRTDQYLKRPLVYTGCPTAHSSIQYDRLQTLKEFGFNNTDKIILVFGGSQGSQKINHAFYEAIDKAHDRLRIQVVHISGKGKLADLELMYKNIKRPYILFEYFEPMEKLYQLVDIVISRSGASTVNELAWFKKPAILVPYRFAGGHQKENAMVLADAKTARIIQEKDLNADQLIGEISVLLENPPSETTFNRLIEELNIKDAAKSLAKAITSCV